MLSQQARRPGLRGDGATQRGNKLEWTLAQAMRIVCHSGGGPIPLHCCRNRLSTRTCVFSLCSPLSCSAAFSARLLTVSHTCSLRIANRDSPGRQSDSPRPYQFQAECQSGVLGSRLEQRQPWTQGAGWFTQIPQRPLGGKGAKVQRDARLHSPWKAPTRSVGTAYKP